VFLLCACSSYCPTLLLPFVSPSASIINEATADGDGGWTVMEEVGWIMIENLPRMLEKLSKLPQ